MNLEPLLLTLKLASITTIILFFISIPISYWLAFSKFKYKYFLEAIINTPLILPPSVLGFYLLLAFSSDGFIGKFLKNTFDINLLFDFKGLIIGSLIFSLPFMVQNIQAGFKNLPSSLREASYSLGKSEFETLIKVLLPNIKPSILSGIVLTFAHTIGEFGVVLMIGGNIEGKTKVISIAIYNEVETLNYTNAHYYSIILLIFSISVLSLVYFLNNKKEY
ncbi:MAG: molybdate ABC transporter permease subunit [Candidatus Sericytochromatia bacterium]